MIAVLPGASLCQKWKPQPFARYGILMQRTEIEYLSLAELNWHPILGYRSLMRAVFVDAPHWRPLSHWHYVIMG